MYNLGGIYHQMKYDAIFFGGIGIIFLICSHFWNGKKRNIKELSIGLFCCICSVCTIGYYTYVIQNLKIDTCIGTFAEELRENPYLVRKIYCFIDDTEKSKLSFKLDILTKKDIYPDEFQKGNEYKVYYDRRTKVIVKVEEVK